jgi:hypothetical protein
MTDDEILRAAETIKKKRLQASRLRSFFSQNKVMIRWQNYDTSVGESYTSVMVDSSDVADLVAAQLGGVS